MGSIFRSGGVKDEVGSRTVGLVSIGLESE